MPQLGPAIVAFAAAHPIITAAAVVGTNLVLGRVLAPKFRADAGGNDTRSARNVTSRATVSPRQTVYGTVRMAGMQSLQPITKTSDANHLWEVNDFCHHEITGFDFLTVHGVEINLATEVNGSGFCTRAEFTDADGNFLLQIIERTGTDAQTAVTELTGDVTALDSNFRGRGVAYLAMKMILDESDDGDPDSPEADVWEKGKPQNFIATIRGKAVYDPRKDSTNGGSGTHRYTDQTTWEHSDNPALCIRDRLTGNNGEITTGQDCELGLGFANSDIDDELVAAAANICDETVTVWANDGVGGTTTQKRYTLDGVVTEGQEPKPLLESMLSAMAGTLIEEAGKIRLFAGAYEAPTVTFTDDDIVGRLVVSHGASLRERKNAFSAIFNDATRSDEPSESQSMALAADATTDGEVIKTTIQLPFTRDEMRAQRLALIARKQARNYGAFDVQMSLVGMQISVNDVVSWTIDELGFTAEPHRCVAWDLQSDGTVAATFARESAAVWTYDAPPAPSDLIEVTRAAVLAATDGTPPAVTALTAATSRNGVLLEWANPSLSNIKRIEVWAATTNNRNTAAIVATTQGDHYEHHLDYDESRYYWITTRAHNNRASAWHPLSSTAGVAGDSGNVGDELSVELSKSAATVTVDSSYVGNLAAAQGVLSVRRGAADVFSSATIDVTTSNCTAEFNTTDNEFFSGVAGAYRITAISGVDAEIIFEVTEDGDTVDDLFDITAIIVATPPFTAFIGGSNITKDTTNGLDSNVGSLTCEASGGVTTYSYSWVRVSGDTAVVANSATSATTSFKSTGTNEQKRATFKCTVTDSDSPPVVIDSNTKRVTVNHGTPAA